MNEVLQFVMEFTVAGLLLCILVGAILFLTYVYKELIK